MTCKEEFMEVKGYEDYFLISSHGRLWSKRTNKFLKLNPSNGYLCYVTKIGGRKGKNLCLKVHRTVAEAFIENPLNKPFVNHKDADKLNNFKDNLEWVTHQENVDHAKELGLLDVAKGTRNKLSSLTEEDVRYIVENYKPRDKTFGLRPLARKFNVTHMVLWRHIKRSGWEA